MIVFQPDYRPVPIFSGIWTVLVLVTVVITASRNDRPFTDLLVEDFWEIVLYVAMGVAASVAAVLWGWRRVQLTDQELIIEKLSTRITGKKQTIQRKAIQKAETKYNALARAQVLTLTLADATIVKIPHNNLRNGADLVAQLKSNQE